MKKQKSQPEHKKGIRAQEFPERQVGFPERNDASKPIDDMERVHVDLDTLDITRTNVAEVTRALNASPNPLQTR